jgi:hypothetical protein
VSDQEFNAICAAFVREREAERLAEAVSNAFRPRVNGERMLAELAAGFDRIEARRAARAAKDAGIKRAAFDAWQASLNRYEERRDAERLPSLAMAATFGIYDWPSEQVF